MFNLHENRLSISISISGIINWCKDRKSKKDVNNINNYQNFILQNQQEEEDQNGEETKR